MKEIRCPECGYRMETNECPICGKRVLLPVGSAQPYQSAQRQKTPVERPKVTFSTASGRRTPGKGAAVLKVLVIVLAVLFVGIPALFLATEQIFYSISEPEDYELYEAYQTGTAATAVLPSIEAQTLFDNGQIKVTADSYGLLYETQAVEVTVTNNTDRNITVSTDELEANGYMLGSSILYCMVQEGETAKGYLQLATDDLTRSGIETVAQIKGKLMIYDSDEYVMIEKDIPLDIKTDAYGLVQPVDDSGTVVFEAEGIRMIWRDTWLETYDYASACFYYENLTDHTVSFNATAAYVNDQEADAVLWVRLLPNTRCVELFHIADVSDYGVKEFADLKQIRLELEICDEQTWQIVTETIIVPLDA